jgi:hypothetical protein
VIPKHGWNAFSTLNLYAQLILLPSRGGAGNFCAAAIPLSEMGVQTLTPLPSCVGSCSSKIWHA